MFNYYDQYYQKGGDYVLPIEVFNDLIGELEELQNKIDLAKRMLEMNIEIIKQQPSNNLLEDKFFINRKDFLKIMPKKIDLTNKRF